MKEGHYARRRMGVLAKVMIILLVLSLFLPFLPNIRSNAAGETIKAFGYNISFNADSTVKSYGWTTGNLGESYVEGEWPAYHSFFVDVDWTELETLGVKYDFYNAGKNARYFDLVRNISIADPDMMGTGLNLKPNGEIVSMDDAYGYPTEFGTPWVILDEEDANLAQRSPNTETQASPTDPLITREFVFNEMQLIDFTESEYMSQVNVSDPDVYPETSPGVRDTVGSDTDAKRIFYITKEQIEEALEEKYGPLGTPADPTDLQSWYDAGYPDKLVMYFQMHLARTWIWNNTNDFGGSIGEQILAYTYSEDPVAPWGGYQYTPETGFLRGSDSKMFGSAEFPGSSGQSFVLVNGGEGGEKTLPLPNVPATTGTISGYKFDGNGNPIEGWRVYLRTKLYAIEVPIETSTLTDANGYYEFTNLPYNIIWRISEEEQDGYLQVYPNSDTNTTDQDGNLDPGTAHLALIQFNTEYDWWKKAFPTDELFLIEDPIYRPEDRALYGWSVKIAKPDNLIETDINFANVGTATKSGYKFEDLDADGSPREAGEPGLSGWTIYVDYNDNNILDEGEPFDVTDESGYYLIENIIAGPLGSPTTWKVKEVSQEGWFNSYPELGYYEEEFLIAEEKTGNDFGNWTPASKSGVKFEDLDADGSDKEAGEPGLAGFTIYVDYNGNDLFDEGEPYDVTAEDGSYLITGITPGTYAVREVQMEGYTQSFPASGEHVVEFTSAMVDTNNNFGNWTTASKSGVKFEDLDADGSDREAGEPGLAGFTIYVDYNGNDLFDEGEPYDVTAEDGSYEITGIVPGTYAVREVQMEGYTQSFPASGEHVVEFISSMVDTNNNFGNWTTATKSGVKFEDLDADGSDREAGEPGLAGFTIYVDYNGNDQFDEGEPYDVTAEDGSYLITGIVPGTYGVREVQMEGYTQSFPASGEHVVEFISSMVDTNNNFGNWKPASKSGVKFEDLDADGSDREEGEPGLAGFTIYVDYNGNDQFDEGEPYDVTAEDGSYLITGILPGTYAVREVQMEGYTQSFPASGEHVVEFTSSMVDTNNNFGNWKPATKSGVKFEDLDADGSDREAGEPGLGGFTIYVDYNGNDLFDEGEPYDVTAEDGSYLITGILPGTYAVREVQMEGYTQSFPASGEHVVEFTSSMVDTNNNFGNWTTASKSGVKFEDLDADGSDREAGEPGLGGFTIYVDYNGNDLFDEGEPYDVTAEDGSYLITGILPGTYAVREVQMEGYTQSFPASGEHVVEFTSSMVDTNNNFGNWTTASKSGVKFEDLDADGSDREAGEPGLAGFTIYVDYNGNDQFDEGEPYDVTAEDGSYLITGILPGTYAVREVQMEGYTQSFPASGEHVVEFTSSMVDTNNNFGNWKPATKSGVKFEDLDADGSDREVGEPGLSGFTIYVDYNGNDLFDEGEPYDVTAEDGSYEITGILPGTYAVREVQMEGYTQSFPASGEHVVEFSSSMVDTNNNFGNWKPASKSGVKFEDLDMDGSDREAGEPGLSGFTIYVDYNGNDLFDEGEPYDVTAEDGSYEITGILPGTYAVREVQMEGYTQSFPASGEHVVEFTSSMVDTNNNFGNWTTATKSGVKFEDLDADGSDREAGEPGLAGFTIYVDYNGNDQFDEGEPYDVTAEDGSYLITGILPGTYGVREVQMEGYTQSFPASGEHVVQFQSSMVDENNNFGNWKPATKSGVKFEDLDADGSDREAGEPGLAGFTIYVDYNGNDQFDEGEPYDITAEDGSYTIVNIMPGTYAVREVQMEGYNQSYPASGEHVVQFQSSTVDVNNNFGNWKPATKSGVKFEDLDVDGLDREAGEPGLSGFRIYVDYNGNDQFDEGEPYDITASDGSYTIVNIMPGTFAVREVQMEGYTQSFPASGEHVVEFSSSMVDTNNNFGNWKPATKSGVKFEDLDADGSDREAGEPGLGGFTIYVDYNGNDLFDEGEPYDVTASDGSYLITGILPGTYAVREVQMEGYTQSFPASGEHVVEFTSSMVDTNNNFGNWTTATKSGVKFEDLDNDGLDREEGEPGLPGFTIYVDYNNNDQLDEGEPFDITAEDGSYLITGIVPGTWRVKEIQQTDWTQTYPASGYHEVVFTSGMEDVNNNFGNWILRYTDQTAWGYLPGYAITFESLGLSNWGWTNGPLAEGSYEMDLYAGAGGNDIDSAIHAGKVYVEYASGVVTVTYEAIYEMTDLHLWVGDTLLPLKKNGSYTNSPGQFPYSATVNGYTYTFEIEDVSGEIYVAAHGVVRIPE